MLCCLPEHDDAWRENFLQTEICMTPTSHVNDAGVTLLDSSTDEGPSPTQSPHTQSTANSYSSFVMWGKQHNIGQTAQCCAFSGFGLLGEESVFMRVARTVLEGLKKEIAVSVGTLIGEPAMSEIHTEKQDWAKDPERNASPDLLSHGLAQLNLLPGSELHMQHAESFQGVVGPHWQRDREAPRCNGCRKIFGMFLRRHHCRRCGKIFCDGCTPHKGPVMEWGYNGLERQCDDCWQVTLRGQQIFPEDNDGPMN